MKIDPRFIQESGRDIYTGNELLVKGALETEGGVHLLTGYPGSPIAGFFDTCQMIGPLLSEHGVVARLSLPATETRTRAYGIDVDEAKMQIARLESLEVGPIALGLRSLFSIDLNPRANADRPTIHGLIGGDVLTLFSGIIDCRSRRLYLKTRGSVEGS